MPYTPITDADPISPIENLINPRFVQAYTDFAAADTAVTAERQIRTYKWATATQRNAQTGMSEGDIGDQADADQRWRYSGSAWVNITNGLFPVVPTSVAGTGVTVGASGKITATNATNASGITVNGCFSAAYDNYLIVIDQTSVSASGVLSMQYTVSGTPTTTGYDYGSLFGLNTTASYSTSLNGSSFNISNAASLLNLRMEVRGPFLTRETQALYQFGNLNNPGVATAMTVMQAMASQRATTSFDGFKISISAGNATLSIRIYGYNNN